MAANPKSLRVTDAYRQWVVRERKALQLRARELWPTIQELDSTKWVERMAVALRTRQEQGVRLSGSYLAAYLTSETGVKVPPVAVDATKYVGVTRDGRPIEEALQSPLVGVLGKLKQGVPSDEALAYGLNRAERMVGVEFDHAHRQSLLDRIDAEPLVEGWQRALAGTCGACAAVADGSVSGSPRFDVHPGCQCISEPVVTIPGIDKIFEKRKFGKAAGYTPDELQFVAQYVGSMNSFLVNQGLRGERQIGGKMQQIADAMDSAIARSGAVGTRLNVHRVLVGDPEKLLGGAGSTVTDAGFGSATASKKYLSEFVAKRPSYLPGGSRIDMELTVDPRVKALWGANPDESELIFQRGCRYVVDSLEKVGDVWQVQATVLPPKI